MNRKKIWICVFACVLMLVTSCSKSADVTSGLHEEYEDIAMENDISYEVKAEATQKKIVKNAGVFIEADDASNAYSKLHERLTQLGGYEFSRNSGANNNNVSIYLVVKIPSENLEVFLEFLKECGDIRNLNVSSNDITDQYYDVQIRLENMRKSLEKYYEFLKNTQNIDEMLKVQAEINRLTAEIESAEGRINLWSKQVAESDVQITIHEKNDPARYSGRVKWNSLSFTDTGNIIKVGFVNVSGTVVSLFQWLIIIIISCLPIIIIAAVIVFLIIYIRKRKK